MNLRILLVIPDALARETISILPRGLFNEYSAFTATNGRFSLSLLQSAPANAVIIDYELPEMGVLSPAPRISTEYPHAKTLALAEDSRRDSILDAFDVDAAENVFRVRSKTEESYQNTRKIVRYYERQHGKHPIFHNVDSGQRNCRHITKESRENITDVA